MASKILVLLTGGTIGMAKNDRGVYEPRANSFGNTLKNDPRTNDQVYAKENFLKKNEFVLPISRGGRRIFYTLLEYSPMKDSSNISVEDWIHMADDIKVQYESYDGFVILHGTDTMAYTSSALSFMLDKLTKPVVLTGARLPISEMMSDAVDNIVNALNVAAEQMFPEVTLLYNKIVFRGNRVTKTTCGSYQPFQSPNIEPLHILTGKKSEDSESKNFNRDMTLQYHKAMSPNVGILLIYPGITAQTVRESLRPPIQGLVMLTFGAGNCPSGNKELLKEIKTAVSRGVIIVNCTQCLKGFVTSSYDTGSVLLEAGVLPGRDMTTEAAFTKLSYVLGQSGLSEKQRKEMILTNIRGEMTIPVANNTSKE